MGSKQRGVLTNAGFSKESWGGYVRSLAELDSVDFELTMASKGNPTALLQLGLIGVGFVPFVGDAVDAIGCGVALNGMFKTGGGKVDSGLSCSAAIPGAGWGAGLAKMRKVVAKASKYSGSSDELNDLRHFIEGDIKATKATKTADDVVGAVCSFGGETRVLMADGTTKPISKVEIGDMVLAQDPETGEIGAREVTATWVHDDDLVRLEIDGDFVRTTEDHPFWDDTEREWQRADQLDAGDMVLTSEGRRVRVGVLVGSVGRGLAYNLTVEGLHTYHVLLGNDAVLVHNTCGIKKDR